MLKQIRVSGLLQRPGRGSHTRESSADLALIEQKALGPPIGAVSGKSSLCALPCCRNIAQKF